MRKIINHNRSRRLWLFIMHLSAIIVWSSFCDQSTIVAQAPLSLDEAIDIGLENNYGVQILKNNEVIAANQNTVGNAGFLPVVGITSDINYSTQNSKLRFFSGEEQIRKGAGNTAFRSGVAANWTAFDGFRMFATKERLELLEKKSQMQTKREMHDLVYQISNAYTDMLRIQEKLATIDTSILLSQELLDLAEAKLGLGATTKLEVLQFTNRIKADSSQYFLFQNQLSLAKIGFNRLIQSADENQFELVLESDQKTLPAFEEILTRSQTENYNRQLLGLDEQIAVAQIKEARSALFPTLDLNAGLNYNWSKSEAGFLLSNRSFGPTIGATVRYDIFAGRDLKKDIESAGLIQENIALEKVALDADIKNELVQFYENHTNLTQIQLLEVRNLRTAQENTSLATELYRAGRATNFEVREAILTETNVRDRIADLEYQKALIYWEVHYRAGVFPVN